MLLPLSLSEEVAKPIFTKVAKKVFPVEKLNLWIEALSISLKRCKVCQEIGKFQYATFAMFSKGSVYSSSIYTFDYYVQKYSNKLSMKALVEKDIFMKKQENR